LCQPIRIIVAPYQAMTSNLHSMNFSKANHLVTCRKS
jgi:hypothetical protein